MQQATLQGKPPFPDIVDNTQRSAFLKCPTSWVRAHCFNLAPASPSIHLHAGGAFARGLEVVRRKFWDEGVEVSEAKRAGLEATIQFYGAFAAPPTRQGDKSLDNVIRALDSYLIRYPVDKDPIKPFRTASGKHMVEFTFSIPTEVKNPSTGNPILYGGRCDMIGDLHGSLFVTDEKTATQLGENWANNWKLDSQFTGYIHAARTHGHPVAGALIRGVGLLKTKISHAEAQVYRAQWEVDRWWVQLNKDLGRMVQSYSDWDFDLALDKAACNAFGGCQFVPLCESPDPEKWMNLYRIRKWNPLAKDFGENLLENPHLQQAANDTLEIDLKDLM